MNWFGQSCNRTIRPPRTSPWRSASSLVGPTICPLLRPGSTDTGVTLERKEQMAAARGVAAASIHEAPVVLDHARRALRYLRTPRDEIVVRSLDGVRNNPHIRKPVGVARI